MKLIVLLAGLTAFTVSGLAQSQQKSIISGKVQDATNKSIQTVTVSLLKAADSSLVKAALTDATGNYEIAVTKSGKFLVRYESLGYEKKYAAAFEVEAGKDYSLPVAVLKIEVKKLQDVTVTSKKPMIEIKADKTIFNVESSINATGSNALELLQKSPGVQVDNNDNISMKGKTGTKIYIDGKPTQLDAKNLAEYLKGINSNDIESIEMISNPSAKYDASGNAGIINIKLKKNKKFGTNGSATAGIVQGLTPKGNASVNVNYRNKKVNLFSNVSGSVGQYENTQNLYRIQSDTLYDQKTVQNNDEKNINIKAGADFFIDSKNTFGVMATTNFGNSVWNSSSNTPISYYPTGQYVKTLTAYNTIPGNRNHANFNMNYKYADTSGKEINVDADYGSFKGRSNSYQPNYYYDKGMNLLSAFIYKNNTPVDIDIYSAKVDVEENKWKGKFGYGLKFSYVITKNTFDFYDVINGQDIHVLNKSNNFVYKENVNAGYVNYQRQLNTKWSIQAGLRIEQTNSDGILTRADGLTQNDDSVKRSYTNLFPSAALTWTINKKNTLNLTYSRRIDRPTYQDLNPFENKLDELTYEKGNAFLRPQYTDNIELTHTFMSMINTTIGYSHVKDYATQVLDTTNKNATYVQQQNLATEQIISFSIGSSLPIKKWWNGYVNFWYSYLLFDGEFNNKVVSLKIPIYGAYLQQSFTLGKNYTAEMSGWFNGPGVWGATGTTKAQGGLDIGIQKQLFDKKATLKLSATDVLATASPWHIHSDFGGLYLDGNGTWESRTIRLNFTYRFGSNQIKSARQRQTSLETEAKRIK